MDHTRGTIVFVALIVTCSALVVIGQSAASAPATQASVSAFRPVEPHRLDNAHVLSGKVIAGAQPEGDAGFQALRDLGIRTILSVDGAKPDVELAHKYGMRYVHLPIGYDGVPKDRGEEIAKALQELPGPIYVHCHHGKHRSAAAVAVACVFNGMLAANQAEDVLKTFGTGTNYQGLWRDALNARRIDPQALDKVKVDYVEAARIPELAEAMIRVDASNDRLKLIQAAGWKTPAGHPDLSAAHEALMLQEHYKEIARLGSVLARPEDFRVQLTRAEQETTRLQQILSAKPINATDADATYKLVAASCTNCHKSYRD